MSSPPGARHTLGLLSINLHGLGDRERLHVLLHEAAQVGVAFLQETHCSDDAFADKMQQRGKGHAMGWKGRFYHAANATNPSHSSGVGILISSSCAHLSRLPDAPQHASRDGRILRVDVVFNGAPLSLVSVYAPTNGELRPGFFSEQLAGVLPAHACIIGGDFNCILSAADAPFGSSPARFRGHQQLQQVMEAHCLVDTYRRLHPAAAAFTHWSASGGTAARLDRILVSGGLSASVCQAGISSCIPSDHSAATAALTVPQVLQRGPGAWRFDASLLNDKEAAAALERGMRESLDAHPRGPGMTAGRRLEAVKVRAQLLARALCARVAQERLKERRQLEAAERQTRAALLAAGCSAAAGGSPCLAGASATGHGAPTALTALGAAWRQAQRALHEHAEQRARTGVTAAGAVEGVYGESSTLYFHRGGRPPPPPTTIAAITDPLVPGVSIDLSTPAGRALGSTAAANYYSSSSPVGVYRRPVRPPGSAAAAACAAARGRLLGAVQRKVPATLAAACEQSVTVAELHGAMMAAEPGKAPGSDGLPMEFWRHFWPLLGPLLAEVVEEAWGDVGSAAPFPASWGQGLVTLIHKGGAMPTDQFSSYRPITLLNCDAKIVARAVANRLQLPLDAVVDATQTAFIKGRCIQENVLFHMFMAEHLEATGQPGCLIILDLKQAYDLCEREWVGEVLPAVGFGPNLCRLVRQLMGGTCSAVMLNGWRTCTFPVNNGLPQGSPLAPILWALQFQPLSALLCREAAAGRFMTPCMPDSTRAPPVHMHADDTKLLVEDLSRDGPPAMAVVEEYCTASNACLAVQKLKGVVLGTHTPAPALDPATNVQFPPAAAPPKLLGMPFTTDLELARDRSYAARKQALHAAIRAWLACSLTFFGRAHVAKQVLTSIFLYHWSVQPPSAAQVEEVLGIVHAFLLRRQRHETDGHLAVSLHPRLTHAALPWVDGGMSLTDMPLLLSAMRAKFVASALSPGSQPWKQLVRQALQKAAPAAAGMDWVLRMVPPPPAPPARAAGSAPVPLPAGVLYCRPHAYVMDFRGTEPHRLGTDQLPFEAIMREPLAYNDAVGCGERHLLQPTALALLFPGVAIPRLQHLRDALQGRRPAAGSLGGEGADTAATAAPAPLPAGGEQAGSCPLLWDAQSPPTPTQRTAAFSSITTALPPTWRTAVRQRVAPEPRWLVHTGCPGLVRECCPSGGGGYFLAHSSGRMQLIDAAQAAEAEAAAADGVWAGACVLQCSKPKHLWTAAECQAVKDAAAAGSGGGTGRGERDVTPQEYRLLGAWDSVHLYPAAWGHGASPLHEYSVKTARQRCVQLRAMDADPEYVVGHGLRPRVWDRPVQQQPAAEPAAVAAAAGVAGASGGIDQPARAATAVQPGFAGGRDTGAGSGSAPAETGARGPPVPQPGRRQRRGAARAAAASDTLPPRQPACGLQALERAWCHDIRRRCGMLPHSGLQQEDLLAQARWMLPSPPRLLPCERAQRGRVDRAAAEAEGVRARPATADDQAVWLPVPRGTDRAAAVRAPSLGYKAAWKRLLDKSLPRAHRATAWRIMHATLACKGFAMSRRTNDTGFARALCSATPCHSSRQVETLTHLFIDCPSVQPALRWLLDVWHAASGIRLQPDPAIVLADDPVAWPGGTLPGAQVMQVWTRLRTAYLHAVWMARDSLGHDDPSAHAAAVAAEVVVGLGDQMRGDWFRVTGDIRTATSVCGSWFRGRDPAIRRELFEQRWTLGGALCRLQGESMTVLFSTSHPVQAPLAAAAVANGVRDSATGAAGSAAEGNDSHGSSNAPQAAAAMAAAAVAAATTTSVAAAAAVAAAVEAVAAAPSTAAGAAPSTAAAAAPSTAEAAAPSAPAAGAAPLPRPAHGGVHRPPKKRRRGEEQPQHVGQKRHRAGQPVCQSGARRRRRSGE